MDRGHGKTKSMVLALPTEGGHIITHSAVMRDYIKRMIYDLRGEPVADIYRIHIIRSQDDTTGLYGAIGHVAIDHAWYQHASSRTQDYVMHLIRTADFKNQEVRLPPATHVSVPKGYVLVPIKPTKEMAHEAACQFYGKNAVAQAGGIHGMAMQARGGDPDFWMAFKKFWKAALAHAPQPSEPAPPQTNSIGGSEKC